VDEVGQAVQLGPEPGRSLEEPGDTPIEPIQKRGEDDGRKRELPALFNRHPDRRQAGAQAEKREEVRDQHAHGNARVAEEASAAAAARLLLKLGKYRIHRAIIAPACQSAEWASRRP